MNSPDDSNASRNLRKSVDLESNIFKDIHAAEKTDQIDGKTSFLGSAWTRIYDLIYPEMILTHLDWRSIKTVLRSWTMMWSLTLLTISSKTEHFMGPSAFLAYFSAGIEIDGNLSVSAAFCYCMSDLVSVYVAFLISVVVMAINWHIRGQLTETEVIEKLVANGLCSAANANFEDCILPQVHRGYFLNIKTTVVTIFGMLFSYTLCGYYQSYSKYGKLAWLLNSLFTIIVFSFNNMTPLWAPWFYARNCLIPMSLAFATRFAVSLLLFPFSSNYKIVRSLSTACMKLAEICGHMECLNSDLHPSHGNLSEIFEFISRDTQAVFTNYIVSDMDLQMVKYLEVWFSRFDEPDLVELRFQVRHVMSSLSSFDFFFQTIASRYCDIKCGAHVVAMGKFGDSSDKINVPKVAPAVVKKTLAQTWNRTGDFEKRQRSKYCNNADESFYFTSMGSSASDSVTVNDLDTEFINITCIYAPLVSSSSELLKLIGQWLGLACQIIPPWRKYSTSKELSTTTEQIRKLFYAHVESINYVKQRVVPKDRTMALYGFLCQNFAVRVKSLATCCVNIYNTRPEPSLTWPFKSRKSLQYTPTEIDHLDYDGYHDDIGVSLEQTYTSFKPITKVQARNPDSSPPRTVWHFMGLGIQWIQQIVYDADFLFSLKRAILVTATLTPYFCRPVCFLAYKNWFLWVSVLTSYTVGRQAVDGIYGFFAKMVYTFYACLVGTVGWYICAGTGRGNPYGFAAVTAVIWLYISFQRQFNKHFAPATSIVYSCTVTVVLGNSWSSGHYPLAGVDLGMGFKVAWIRFVTVVIGIAISFVGTILPYAYTAKQAVRTIVGNCLEHLGELHSSVANFGIQRFHISSTHILASNDVVTKSARRIISNLESAETLRKRLVYEPPLSGRYPTYRYKLLIRYVHEVTLLYSLIYSFLDQVKETSQIPQLLIIMGWTDPKLCSGAYSIIYMCGRALTDATPLPSVTPANLMEYYMFDMPKNHILENPGLKSKSLGITAIALSCQIYERLDGILILIKELVGEVYDLNMDLFDFDLEKQQ